MPPAGSSGQQAILFLEIFMAFELPKLPYDYDALEPTIDSKTMKLHYSVHHKGYVDKLNEALKDSPELEKYNIETLMWNLNKISEDLKDAVQNQGGGHVNHSMLWKIMARDGGGKPRGRSATNADEIREQIKKDFGSFEKMKAAFTEAGTKQFGSGWVWLIYIKGKLEIVTTPNQDTPLSDHNYPVMGNDVFEHAYYLKYGPKRDAYLDAWWSVANWNEINRRFGLAKKYAENKD